MGEAMGRAVRDVGKWRKPTCCQNGECAEVRELDGFVMMRKSTRPEEVIAVSDACWPSFIAALKAGQFDLPS